MYPNMGQLRSVVMRPKMVEGRHRPHIFLALSMSNTSFGTSIAGWLVQASCV